MHSTSAPVIRALVLAVDLRLHERPLAPELAEFQALIEASGAVVVETVIQRRSKVDPATMIGAGLAQTVAQRVHEGDLAGEVTTVFMFNDLRPRQRANLEKIVPLPIVDRTMLILDIFASRARSKEGRLQVELAQLRFRQSNLIGWGVDLSRLGGGIGSRGPGETKLEVDRRRIQARVTTLRKELGSLRTQRKTRRGDGDKDPLVALVGYTNVGKSSLLNRLARTEGSQQAFVADQPFATLDPTMRRVFLTPELSIRLVDTVGFITELPKELVNAFMATLEELQDADLLLHVVDASNPDWLRQYHSVNDILEQLSLRDRVTLVIANKIDHIGPATLADDSPVEAHDVSDEVSEGDAGVAAASPVPKRPPTRPLPEAAIAVSAATGEGIDLLRQILTRVLLEQRNAPSPDAA